jgi:ligand-binding SRPBCC domain-containing protein
MPAFILKSVQKIPASIEEVWAFFSTPANLNEITPGNIGFRLLSGDQQTALYEGQVFEYKVSPMLRIPLYWKTEISKVNAPYHFIDRQAKGPYKLWEHHHHFKSIDGGVEMTDIVYYKNPFYFLGIIANRLFVKKRLRQIFAFRFAKVEELFGKWPDGQQMKIEIN